MLDSSIPMLEHPLQFPVTLRFVVTTLLFPTSWKILWRRSAIQEHPLCHTTHRHPGHPWSLTFLHDFHNCSFGEWPISWFWDEIKFWNCWQNWMALYLLNVVRHRHFNWRTQFGEIDPQKCWLYLKAGHFLEKKNYLLLEKWSIQFLWTIAVIF